MKTFYHSILGYPLARNLVMSNISIKGQCKDCLWPIVVCLCNDEMGAKKPYSEWDWWHYCSNKGCKNHKGEGVFQKGCSFKKDVI